MKKKMLLGILLGVLLVAGNSFADPIITVQSDYNNTTAGGPFYVMGDLGPFYTFCLESNEYLNIGGSYEVAISNSVVGGGSGGQIPPPNDTNALSYAAAYLYLKWLGLADKTQSGVNDAYQNAIWYAEGEGGIKNTLYDEAFAAVASWTDYNGVVVLNLSLSGVNKQSLLGLAVPEPAPCCCWVSAWSGLQPSAGRSSPKLSRVFRAESPSVRRGFEAQLRAPFSLVDEGCGSSFQPRCRGARSSQRVNGQTGARCCGSGFPAAMDWARIRG